MRRDAEKTIDEIFNDNQSLLQSQSIHSCEELVEALGDRYIHERRDALMKALPEKEQAFLREYYLRNCRAGKDRCPACLKVTIEYKKGSSWTPVGRDYLSEYKVEYDRIYRKATCELRSKDHVEAKITAFFDEVFEDRFFSTAEESYWKKGEDHYMIDHDKVTISCVFADGTVRDSGGNSPAEDPFRTLYGDSREEINRYIDSVRV